MKRIFYLLVLPFIVSLTVQDIKIPSGFVYAKDIIPDLDVELRYFSDNNFVGDTIDSYKRDVLIITEPTAKALKNVQEDLQKRNLCLRVYDGYRPQTAVNHFIRWARELNDTIMKQQFYPGVKKSNLFNEGYIASKSGHSRGSTLDLTIIDASTSEPLDMGSPYDFFGERSWIEYQDISKEQKENRKLLQTVMLKHGFQNYPKEWWHFTLGSEPYPETYFDFPIE